MTTAYRPSHDAVARGVRPGVEIVAQQLGRVEPVGRHGGGRHPEEAAGAERVDLELDAAPVTGLDDVGRGGGQPTEHGPLLVDPARLPRLSGRGGSSRSRRQKAGSMTGVDELSAAVGSLSTTNRPSAVLSTGANHRPHTEVGPAEGVDVRNVDLDHALVQSGGTIARRDHPALRSAIDHRLEAGALLAPLPGVVAHPELVDELMVRARIAQLWRPDAVLTGRVAAHLTFWPELRVDQIEVAVPRRTRTRRPGYRVAERVVPAELVQARAGLRLTAPALTTLDLVPTVGADVVDRALRSRTVTLPQLRDALSQTSGRRGNRERRWVLLDSRDEPWSAAERKAHRLLRAAGITGWTANLKVRVRGRTCYLDIAFDRERVAIEIDGRAVHDTAAAFEADRARQNFLVLDGWLVLRFTWAMLCDDPAAVIAAICAALAGRHNAGSFSGSLPM
jgi:very-short-patch-repair endonuclease